MGKAAPKYSRECFFDAARRRAREARVLLDDPQPQKQRDGAVTIALLAAECALKAALLHGMQANTTDELNGPLDKLFQGKKGHDLGQLWLGLPTSVATQAGTDEVQSMQSLKVIDRYQHRYGLKKPNREHAEPLVICAERLVKWMQIVVT